MKSVRTVRYFLIELLYTGIMLYFFNYMQMTYSVDTVFDHSLFMIICLGLIALIWFIGPMLNRYFVLVYGAVYLANIGINGIGEWPETNDWYLFLSWGYPTGILIFAIICLVTWLIGLMMRKLNRAGH